MDLAISDCAGWLASSPVAKELSKVIGEVVAIEGVVHFAHKDPHDVLPFHPTDERWLLPCEECNRIGGQIILALSAKGWILVKPEDG